MKRPNLPTMIQFGFFCFWLANVWLGAIQDFLLIFIVMVFVGGLWGTSYTNFLYLANAKLSLSCDMGLTYYERELTLNVLLIASDLGFFFAELLAFTLKSQQVPELVLKNPN